MNEEKFKKNPNGIKVYILSVMTAQKPRLDQSSLNLGDAATSLFK